MKITTKTAFCIFTFLLIVPCVERGADPWQEQRNDNFARIENEGLRSRLICMTELAFGMDAIPTPLFGAMNNGKQRISIGCLTKSDDDESVTFILKSNVPSSMLRAADSKEHVVYRLYRDFRCETSKEKVDDADMRSGFFEHLDKVASNDYPHSEIQKAAQKMLSRLNGDELFACLKKAEGRSRLMACTRLAFRGEMPSQFSCPGDSLPKYGVFRLKNRDFPVTIDRFLIDRLSLDENLRNISNIADTFAHVVAKDIISQRTSWNEKRKIRRRNNFGRRCMVAAVSAGVTAATVMALFSKQKTTTFQSRSNRASLLAAASAGIGGFGGYCLAGKPDQQLAQESAEEILIEAKKRLKAGEGGIDAALACELVTEFENSRNRIHAGITNLVNSGAW